MTLENERLQHEGRLAEAQNDARRIALAIGGLVKSLRGQLDPFAPVDDLDGEQIADQALRLNEQLIAHREKTALVAALKKALGRA